MTAPIDTRIIQRYVLGPVKSWVAQAADLLGSAHGIRTVGGYRTSSTVPNSDHPKGRALDFITSSKAQGDALAADAVANARALGITYVIWWRQIWTPSQGWHPYSLVADNPHEDHVHVSFQDRPGSGQYVPKGGTAGGKPATDLTAADETCAWKISGPAVDIPDILPGPNELSAGGMCIVSKKQMRQLIGGMLLVAGGVTLAVGLILLVTYGLQKTPVGATATDVARVFSRMVPGRR